MNNLTRAALRISAALVVTTLLQSCLQTAPKININVLKAPEFDEALKYKVYSVRPFTGLYSAQMTRDIDTALASNRVDGVALIKTVPFDATLQTTGKGKSLTTPVDAIVGGEVTTANWNDQSQNRVEQECVVQGDKKILGISIDCKQSRDVTRYCTKRSAHFAAAVRVTDAKDQRTVWGRNFSHSVENLVCQHEQGKSLPSGESMLGAAYAQVMNQVRSALIATEQKLAVSLMEDPDGLPEAAKVQFTGAVAFAKEGRMDRACELFGALYEQHKQSVSLTYSMALCQEAVGRLWEAIELYKTADGLTQKPMPVVSEALTRVSLHVKDANKVRGIGKEPVAPVAQPMQTIKDQALSTAQKAQVLGEHRIALVIGNARYRNISALRNSVNDAQDMEVALKNKGFTVIRVSDGTREQIIQAVRSFELKIKENTTALIFYAGHGVQARGVNYLIPVDARIQSISDLSTEAIDMDLSIMRRLEDRNPRLSIIILDACRNNPFPATARSAGEQAGLASINAPRGSIVAFSTAPNRTAEDGTGRNGLYTKHLLKELQVPNRKIEDIFKRVRENVMKESANGQTPWENSALTGDFYFSVTR
jgi:tetratricopeptide (TPR) repeat protein